MAASLHPKSVSKGDGWWYEDEGGIQVVVPPSTRIEAQRIRWSDLLKAAKRCGKKV